jgi:AbrB family looped-hinge helix DNA binding protein
MDERVSKTKTTERLLTRPDGATMRDIIAATGSPQYNELKRLSARGYTIRKVKEGSETRYFARPPQASSFDAVVTSKGQLTIPKEVRERLRIRSGSTVRFTLEDGNRATMSARPSSILDLVGILPKPKRKVTLEEMDEGIRQAAVDRFLRAVGKKK